MKRIILLILVFACISIHQVYAIDSVSNKIIQNVDLRSAPGSPDMGFGRTYRNGDWETSIYMNSLSAGMMLRTIKMDSREPAMFTLAILNNQHLSNSYQIKINNNNFAIPWTIPRCLEV